MGEFVPSLAPTRAARQRWSCGPWAAALSPTILANETERALTNVERGAGSPAWWEVHVPAWAGIVILTVIVTALTGFLPELAFLVLWPLTVLVPPVTTYVRALQRSWGVRPRRGAFWSAAASIVIAVAMITLQVGRMTNPEPGRAQYLAANVIGFGLPLWFLWSLWDTLGLFRRRRSSR